MKNRYEAIRDYPPWISPSQLSLFRQCPLSAYIHYQITPPTKPGLYLVEGQAVHLLIHQSTEKDVPPEDILTPSLKEHLVEMALEAGATSDGASEMIGRAVKTANKYLKMVLNTKRLDPLASESIVTVYTPVVRLVSVMDLVARRGFKFGGNVVTGIQIVDYKTGRRAKTKKDAENDVQLNFYMLVVNYILSILHDRVPGFFLEPSVASYPIYGNEIEEFGKRASGIIDIEGKVEIARSIWGDRIDFAIKEVDYRGVFSASMTKGKGRNVFKIIYGVAKEDLPMPGDLDESVRPSIQAVSSISPWDLATSISPRIPISAAFVSAPNYSDSDRAPSWIEIMYSRHSASIIASLIDAYNAAKSRGEFPATGAICYRCYPEICRLLLSGIPPAKVVEELDKALENNQ